MLRPELAAQPGFLARFSHEARLSTGLAHRDIVAVYDSGSDDGLHHGTHRAEPLAVAEPLNQGPGDPPDPAALDPPFP